LSICGRLGTEEEDVAVLTKFLLLIRRVPKSLYEAADSRLPLTLREEHPIIVAALILMLVAVASSPLLAAQKGVKLSGQVKDALGHGIPKVEIKLLDRSKKVLARAFSDDDGRFTISDVKPGVYLISVEKIQYRTAQSVIEVGPKGPPKPVIVVLESMGPLTMAVRVKQFSHAQNSVSSSGSSQFTYSAQDINDMPLGDQSNVNSVMELMPGVVRDANGQFHIRGEMQNFQWRINGVMLPLDTTNGFVQFLQPRFIEHVSLLDGILPAEYGYRDSGVIDIHTKDGCNLQGGDATMFGGQRETVNPAVEYGGCGTNYSYYATGYYQQSNLGLSQATPGATPIHDFVHEGQGFGYFSYQLSPFVKFSLFGGIEVNNNQFPNWPGVTPQYTLAGVNPANYPSTMLNENLDTRTYFAVAALQGTSGKLDYQLAYATHYVTINFLPDPIGDLIYLGVASSVFHSDYANQLTGDFVYHLSEAHTLNFGFYAGEYGVELDDTSLVFPATVINGQLVQTSDVPITVIDNLNKINWLLGLYAGDTWRLTKKLSLIYGVRFDQMLGFVNDNAFTPRLNALYQASETLALHAGVARYFQTPEFGAITTRSASAFAGTTQMIYGYPVTINYLPVAETDTYFDVGGVKRLSPHLVYSTDGYFFFADNEIDTGQLGETPIYAPFNWKNGRNWGVENSLTYNGKNWTAVLNYTYSMSEGEVLSTGQFNFSPEEVVFLLDHFEPMDHAEEHVVQTFVTYRMGRWMLTADSLFGSGLYGGFANTQKMPVYWQVDAGVGRAIYMPPLARDITTRLSVINVFNRTNLARNGEGIGVFAPSYYPRLAVYGWLEIPFGAPGGKTHTFVP